MEKERRFVQAWSSVRMEKERRFVQAWQRLCT